MKRRLWGRRAFLRPALPLSVIVPLALVMTTRTTLARRISAAAIVPSGWLPEF